MVYGPTALAAAALLLAACASSAPHDEHYSRPDPCTPQWYAFVEARVPSRDAAGHGPDPGSREWKSVIEFKLGIRGDSSVPDIDSMEWCRHIDDMLAEQD